MNKTIFLKINRHTRCGEVGITWPVDYDETTDEEGNLDNVTRMVDKIHAWGDTLHPGMLETPEKPPEKPEKEEAPPPPPVEETPLEADVEAQKRAAGLPARPGAKKKAAKKKAAGKTVKKTVRASSLRKRAEEDVPPEPPISKEEAEDLLVDFAECCVDTHPEITEYNDEDYDDFVLGKLSEHGNTSFEEMCKLPKSKFMTCLESIKASLIL